jgi:hypothetical protein
MQYKFLLVTVFIFSNLCTGDPSILPAGEQKSISLRFKKIPVPFWALAKKKDLPTDTASLKQSNWYAEAINGIEESEYEIKYHEPGKDYVSSNRKNNLRSFFSSNTFTLLPRNDSIDKWELKLTTLGVYASKKLIYRPSEKPVITLNKKDIQFNQDDNFITEYINNKEGVRQNFIIKKEPVSKPQTLIIKLQTNNDWFVNKVHDKEIHFAKSTKTGFYKKITYNGLRVWDANNEELDASFVVMKNEISICVNTREAAYPVTIDPISTPAAAILECNQANSMFGISVSSAGDVNSDGYSDVLVGAELYSNGNSTEGAAFVFHGSSTGVSTTPATVMESNQDGVYMGESVGLAGDVNGDGYSDVIVGATRYFINPHEGFAFVYHGSPTGINPTPATLLPGNQSGALMGFSVNSAGDVNADGYSDVVVGAVWYSNGQIQEGNVCVYHGSPAGLSTVPAISIENNIAGSNLGSSVASAGDINGDGYSDIVVGADYYSNGQVNEGAVYVYHGSATGINPTATLSVESNQAGAFLGRSVSSAGDVNGDGYADVLMGAWGYDNGQNNEGIFYLYHGSASGIVTPAAATVEGNMISANLGISVASAGDINGDGFSDVMVSAGSYTNGQGFEGAGFVYIGSATGLNTSPIAILENNQANAVSYSSASAGDVNGDGYSDVIVGSHGYDNGQINEGVAFVYHGSPSGLSATLQAQLESNQANAQEGYSVASAGDINGDGYSDVIVGARYFTNGEANEGAAFIYHGSATGLNSTIQTTLQINVANAFFGSSVAGAGDVNGDGYSDVIVSNVQAVNGGCGAFIFHGSPAGIINTVQTQLTNGFGSWISDLTVASAGDVNGDGYSDVIIGCSYFENGQTQEGGAFVYHGSATGITTTIQRQLEVNQAFAYFGFSVAGAGDVNGDGYGDVIVGSRAYTNVQPNEGVAFVFHGSASGIGSVIQAQLEINPVNAAAFGYCVAGAGDVNGDGYSDVIVGATQFNNGQTNEGAAFVFHGSASGINTAIQAQLEINQAFAQMGNSVASAGDINGDGYSDVVVGVSHYNNGQTEEGAMFIYHGSTSGINTAIQAQQEGNQAFNYLGCSIASSGDVNGDGYSDIIVGSFGFANGETNEGAAFVYLGNNPGTNKRNNLRLYNQDLVTPIQQINTTQPNLFGAGLFAKSPLGRAKGKLVWEVKGQGVPFSGNPITNSVAYLDKQTSFTDLGIAGIELKNNVQKVGSRNNKVRVRIEYHKATATTGQVYGPWRYPPGYTMGAYGMNSIPLPVTLISFNGRFVNTTDVQLNWITTNEVDMENFTVERSADGVNFFGVGQLPAKGQGSNRVEYSLADKDVQQDLLYYRLRLKEKSGQKTYSKTITVSRSRVVKNFLSPNPVMAGQDAVLGLQSANSGNRVTVIVYNLNGQALISMQQLLQSGSNRIRISTKELATGMYVVSVSGDGIRENFRLLVQ